MPVKKIVPSLAPTPLSNQPAQLELFRLVSDDAYANAFDFYESIPRFMISRWRGNTVTWNPDGTAAPLRREYTYQGKRYKLTVAPAYIDKGDGTLRAEFPGVKEEVLELVLTKLAMDRGYFTERREDEPASDAFVLFTSLYQIAEELKTREIGNSGSRTYSYAQIREALHVLAKTKIHLQSEDDNDELIFSPIADFGFFNEKTRSKAPADIGRATIYIRFNVLISQAILSCSWRQINYERIMGADQYLVRWLGKILSLRFTYAAPNKTFNLKLSTIIESSGVSLYERMSDNLKAVSAALSAMPDVVARFTVEKSYAVNPSSGKGRIMLDAKFIIRPTNTFCVEQMKTNLHVSVIDAAVVISDGEVMTEPSRTDHPSFTDYQKAKTAFLTGRKIPDNPK